MQFIQSQILFYISIILVLFLPGYCLLLAIFGKNKFAALERLVISLGLSVILVDFLMLFMNRFGILITRMSLLIIILLFSLGCYLIYKIKKNKKNGENAGDNLFKFSKNQTILIISIIFLSVFIRTAYLQDNILPSTTDLGHHMYWSKAIAESGEIPDYTKRDIVNVGGTYGIGQPEKISDFIIGEHLIFSAFSLISGMNVISYFPILILNLINLMTVLAVFIFAIRLFANFSSAKSIAITALFLIGPVFAVAPPQAKFVGGGVSGNIIANLLVILAFYFFLLALRHRNKTELLAGIFFSMGIFYTHHLTGLLFLFSIILFILISIVYNAKKLSSAVAPVVKMVFSLPIILFLIFSVIFVFEIYTPSYLKNSAVNTVIGGPSKADHTGLAFSDLKFIVGEPRMALGLAGIAIFLILVIAKKDNKNQAEFIFLFAWTAVMLSISLYPAMLQIDIPSGRVANYGSYPLAFLGAFALFEFFSYLRAELVGKGQRNFVVKGGYFSIAFLLVICFIFAAGFYDSSQYATRSNDSQKTVQTFHSSEYLSERLNLNDNLLADHVYIASDSWIKIFFMRDYNFPLYRANLDRYANSVDKNEACTLWMISTPNSADSSKCYGDLGIDFVMVNRKMDGPQFKQSNEFWQVYSNNELGVFFRPNSQKIYAKQ